MAKLPQPTGLDTMLLELAKAIGQGARALPEESRSAVGAVALKRAEVEVKFDLAAKSVTRDVTTGIGVRHNLIGTTVAFREGEQNARNSGRISMEIVAINDLPAAEPDPAPGSRPAPEPKPVDGAVPGPEPAPGRTPAATPAAVRTGIADARRLLADAMRAGRIDAQSAAKINAVLDAAMAALTAGDTAGAQARLMDAARRLREAGEQPQ